MTLLLNAVVLISPHTNCCRITFVSNNTVDLKILYDISMFLKPPSLQSLQVVSFVIFEVQSFQINYFCIFSNSLTTQWGILVKRARKTIIDIANVLDTTILPPNVRFFILHKFRTPCIFGIMFIWKKFYRLLFFNWKRSIQLRL